jgi:GntP family gluconate:H+ symporter
MSIVYLLLSVIIIIVLTVRLNVHAFFALVIAAIVYALCVGMPLEAIVNSITDGFGSTLGKIGLIIIFGVVIGTFLENTGGAYVLAETILNIVGSRHVTTAMGIVGYFISIPVFADSGFMLMAPIAKSLSKKTLISITGPGIALMLGLSATHTLVPPTPGPVAAAGILDADIGIVMMIGLVVSAVALIPAIIFASRYASRTYIDPNPEVDVATIAQRYKEAPGVLRSSIPILVPIIFIVLKSVIGSSKPELSHATIRLIEFLGEPSIALLLGVLLCLILPKKLDKQILSASGWIGSAFKNAASILLITGAGGIFGKMLQNSGIAAEVGDTLVNLNIGIFLPFILAAAIKSAQGSSTVALITTASMIAPMMVSLGFTTELQKAMVVISIGSGSMVVSHANDSGFWVLTQLTGMSVGQGYRLQTVGTLVLGTSACMAVYLAYILLT